MRIKQGHFSEPSLSFTLLSYFCEGAVDVVILTGTGVPQTSTQACRFYSHTHYEDTSFQNKLSKLFAQDYRSNCKVVSGCKSNDARKWHTKSLSPLPSLPLPSGTPEAPSSLQRRGRVWDGTLPPSAQPARARCSQRSCTHLLH